MRRSDALAWIALIGGLAGGCAPRCDQACAKVLDCGLGATRVAHDECVVSCQREADLYSSWEDQQKLDAYAAHKRCLASSSCEEIAAGACYDEELFVF